MAPDRIAGGRPGWRPLLVAERLCRIAAGIGDPTRVIASTDVVPIGDSSRVTAEIENQG